MSQVPRILVIRGGAIGDFILTLPALRLLRETFPQAHLEILGYKHIIALAEGRFYAEATRSIEYAPMAAFFTPAAELSPELVEYFGSFQQVISYLYDPNGYFEANVRRAGVRQFLAAFARTDNSDHAARQLARPLEKMALFLEDPAARVFPSESDRLFASEFLAGCRRPLIALHPGSGSLRKNWLVERWASVASWLLDRADAPELLVIGGEADGAALTLFQQHVARPVRLARDLSLPHLAAVLENCELFLGHDSGISHLAAAVGVQALLLFGPTDPAVWAPANAHVEILQAPGDDFARLRVAAVQEAIVAILTRGRA